MIFSEPSLKSLYLEMRFNGQKLALRFGASCRRRCGCRHKRRSRWCVDIILLLRLGYDLLSMTHFLPALEADLLTGLREQAQTAVD